MNNALATRTRRRLAHSRRYHLCFRLTPCRKLFRRPAAHRRGREIHLRIHPRSQDRSPKRGLLKPLQTIEQSGAYHLRFTWPRRMRPSSSISRLASCQPARLPRSHALSIARAPDRSICKQRIQAKRSRSNAMPNYGRKPPLAGVVFKIVPDAMVRVFEFKQGAIDFMQNDLEPDMLPWLKNRPPKSALTRARRFNISASILPIRFCKMSRSAKRSRTPSTVSASFVIC